MDSGQESLLNNQQDNNITLSSSYNNHPFEAVTPPIRNDDGEGSAGTTTKLYSIYNPEDELIKAFTDFTRPRATSRQQYTKGINDPEPDIQAMSMASLWERDFKAMDTDNASKRSSRITNVEVELSDGDDFYYLEEVDTMVDNSPDKCQNANFCNNNNTKNCCHAPPNPFEGNTSLNNSLYFADGLRSVDFVLAWDADFDEAVERTNVRKRTIFEENLINQGLELESESISDDIFFVKIHAPLEVLRRYAEILKLRMPMKEIPGMQNVRDTTSNFIDQLKGVSAAIFKKILVDERHFPKRSQRFTAIYSRDKEYLFDLNAACFFTAAVRSRIVQFILDRQRFSPGHDDDFAFGIDRLVSEGVYLAAYPLHDGEINVPGSMRNLLYTEWASVRKWYRYQPLDYVKEYFGVKIGLYFAWLGYYTYMLLLASIVGLVCFIYAWATLPSYIPSNDVCSGKLNIKMCPLCDHWCDYWDLKETCVHARITYLIDNPTTVFFAIFMSFWATLFLELWKRYSAEITHRWDLTGFDVREEHPRPQYLARLAHVKKVKIDYVTNTKEPQPPFWRMKLPATVFSFSIVLLLVVLALAAVLAVVLYRMSIMAALRVWRISVSTSEALIITTATAAVINLCLIFIFNSIYTYLAEYLTELELLRTQTEFDDSLTLKIYLLQFVNYYASIFYIAFFKGKFVGYPGYYNRLLDYYRQEECGFGGCLMELCIQLSIIMVGKQAMNSILEMLLPVFYKWLNIMKVKYFNKNRNLSLKGKGERWLKDLKLVDWGPRSLFPEYLEMVLQYGFVTIFVAAFPLAPFFALLNNILEMRLDAKKLLTYHRRPVSQRVRDIGVWYRILDSIGKLSVITNGFIIAFTSDFIPRFVYQISGNGSLTGYMNYTLAYFNTSDFDNRVPRYTRYAEEISVCRYPDYREPPWSEKRYQRTTIFWVILACRLAFVVIFENIVALVMIIVRWCIPDMSNKLRDQIRREAYITNEIIIRQETLRAKAGRDRSAAPSTATVEPDASIEQTANFVRMEKLMSGKLSQSELDLVMHAPGEPTAPGHCPPDKYKLDETPELNEVITTDTPDIGPASV